MTIHTPSKQPAGAQRSTRRPAGTVLAALVAAAVLSGCGALASSARPANDEATGTRQSAPSGVTVYGDIDMGVSSVRSR